jgi:itaconate CoA-transferase
MSLNIVDAYQAKRRTPAEAALLISGSKNLILGMGLAMPPALMAAVADALRNDLIEPLNLYYMHGTAELQQSLLSPDLRHKVHPRPLFLSSHDRTTVRRQELAGWIEFVPANFHQVGRLLTEHISPDCFVVTVSPMDRHGYFSLGTNADYGASVIRKAKQVILEVNRHMPRTFGECLVHISEVAAVVEHNTPLGEVSTHAPTPADYAIAQRIAERIDDADTLQIGIGGVPNAVLDLLHNHKDLGLHTELFSPAMVKLIESGVINGSRKTWMQHKHVFTLALGNKAMFDFMDDNPSIVGYPASWVNNPAIIRKNRNMVSVNSALEVDLTGQINAEELDGLPFSGTGGQLDFVRGAYSAPNGRSFIALHATAKQGTQSRIVARLTGSTVTDTRMDTQFVVTEHGCVNLKGLSLQQRARSLIDLASPEFRARLEQQAQALGLL